VGLYHSSGGAAEDDDENGDGDEGEGDEAEGRLRWRRDILLVMCDVVVGC
jgi:hypothetical protein